MNFTEEQLAFRDGIRRMVERHVAPIAAEIDETDRFPTELLPIYGDMGLMQLWVPERYGGPEGNLTLMCIAREEISRVSPACGSIAGLNTMFIMPLLHFGTEEQRAALPAEDRAGRRRHGDRDLGAAGRLRRQRDVDARGPRRRQLRHQRQEAMVQLRRRGRVHRADGAHRRRSRRLGHQRLRARAEEDEGHHLRPPREEDGLARRAEHPDLPRQRAGAGREPGRRGGQGLPRLAARARPEPADDRRAVRRPRAGRARCVGCVREGTQAVQAADRRFPGRPVHARRHGDAASRRRARWSTNARRPATPATGTSSTCWRAWRSASPATWR